VEGRVIREVWQYGYDRAGQLTAVNRTGFVGGPIQREDGFYGTTKSVLP
jgi:hypothetical protein